MPSKLIGTYCSLVSTVLIEAYTRQGGPWVWFAAFYYFLSTVAIRYLLVYNKDLLMVKIEAAIAKGYRVKVDRHIGERPQLNGGIADAQRPRRVYRPVIRPMPAHREDFPDDNIFAIEDQLE